LLEKSKKITGDLKAAAEAADYSIIETKLETFVLAA
jgi:hypothetical protein